MADAVQAGEESFRHERKREEHRGGDERRNGGVIGEATEEHRQEEEEEEEEEEEGEQKQHSEQEKQHSEQQWQQGAANGWHEQRRRDQDIDQHAQPLAGLGRTEENEGNEAGNKIGVQLPAPGEARHEQVQAQDARGTQRAKQIHGLSKLTTTTSGSSDISASGAKASGGESGGSKEGNKRGEQGAAEWQGDEMPSRDGVWNETTSSKRLLVDEDEPVRAPLSSASKQLACTEGGHRSSSDKSSGATSICENGESIREHVPSTTAAAQQQGRQQSSLPGSPSKTISGDDDDIWIVEQSGASRFDEDHFLRILHSTDSALARMQEATKKNRSQPQQGPQRQQPQQQRDATGSAPAKAAVEGDVQVSRRSSLRSETPSSHQTSFRAASISSSRERHKQRHHKQRQPELSFEHLRHDRSHGAEEAQVPGMSALSLGSTDTPHTSSAPLQHHQRQQRPQRQQQRDPTPRRRPSMTRQVLQSTSHMSETQVMALLEQSDHILSYLHTINTSTPPGDASQSPATPRSSSLHSSHATSRTASSLYDSQHRLRAHTQSPQQQQSHASNMSASSFTLSSPPNQHRHQPPHGGAIPVASSPPRSGRSSKATARSRDASPSFAARLRSLSPEQQQRQGQRVSRPSGDKQLQGYDWPDHYRRHHHGERGGREGSPLVRDGSYIGPSAFATDVDTSAAVEPVASRSPRHPQRGSGFADTSSAFSPASAAGGGVVARQHSDVTHDRGSPRLLNAGHTPPLCRKRRQEQTSPLHLVSLARDAISGAAASDFDTMPSSLSLDASTNTSTATDKQPATATTASGLFTASRSISASPQHMAELSRQLTALRNETNPVLLQALADVSIEDLASASILPQSSKPEQPRASHAPTTADAVLQWCTKLDLHRVKRRLSSAPSTSAASRQLIVTEVQPPQAEQSSAASGSRGPATVLPDDRDVSLSQDRLLQGEQWSHFDCLMHPSHEPALARLIGLLPSAEEMEASLQDTLCDAVLMRRPNEKRTKLEQDATFCYKAAASKAFKASADAHGSKGDDGGVDKDEAGHTTGARGKQDEVGEEETETRATGEVAEDRSASPHSDEGAMGQGAKGSESQRGNAYSSSVGEAAERAGKEHMKEATRPGENEREYRGEYGAAPNHHQQRQEVHAAAEEEDQDQEEDGPASALGVLAGALITMIDSFPDHVTGDMPLGNTQILEGTAVHAAYVYLDNDYVLAVSCAASLCSFSYLQQQVATLVNTLTALYSDVQALLVEQQHQRLLVAHLTRFFAHLLDSCARGSTGHTSIYSHPISLNTSCMKQPLPVKIAAEVEAAVAGLAVCGGSCNLPRRNAVICRGAALLYKSHTVHATLAPAGARAVLAVCRHVGLFDHLMRSGGGVEAFVFWHPLHIDTHSAKDGTHSLLVVASGPAAVCMLLQAAPHAAVSADIDRVHVDRANLCLHALNASGTLQQLDSFFKSPGLVKTATPSQEHPGMKTYDSQSSFAESLPSASPRKDAPSFYSAPGETQGSPQTVLYDEAVQRRLTIAGVRRRPRVIRKALYLPSLEHCDPRAMVASGRGNAVFHFLATEPQTGLVFVSDPPHDRILSAHSLQARVLSQFHKAARRLRTQLLRHRNSSASTPTTTTPASGFSAPAERDPIFSSARALTNMEEHGLMFTVEVPGSSPGTQASSASSSHDAPSSSACNPALSAFQRRRTSKKTWSKHGEAQASSSTATSGPVSPLSYWVVGRLLPPRSHKAHQQHHQQQDSDYRELYVCFRDGAGQRTADVAFKLFTGL